MFEDFGGHLTTITIGNPIVLAKIMLTKICNDFAMAFDNVGFYGSNVGVVSIAYVTLTKTEWVLGGMCVNI